MEWIWQQEICLKTTSSILIQTTTKMGFLFTMEKVVGAADSGMGRNQEFSFSVILDVAEVHAGGDVEKASGETSLLLRGEVQAGDINLGATSV